MVNSRLLMTSVSSERQTLANRGWERRAARAASTSSRELNAVTCNGGGTAPAGATLTSGLNDPHRLGAGPAIYAHARSSESCEEPKQGVHHSAEQMLGSRVIQATVRQKGAADRLTEDAKLGSLSECRRGCMYL